MLASPSSAMPSISNGVRRLSATLLAVASAAASPVSGASRIANSSPPSRASSRAPLTSCSSRRATCAQQAIAVGVPERVVDVAEAVDVEQEQRQARLAGGDELVDRLAEALAVDQPGEPVVRRLVMAARRLAPRDVHREEQHDEERIQLGHRAQRDDHDRREAEQHSRRQGAEAEVVAQVRADGLADVERHSDADEHGVDDEERGCRDDDRREIARDERHAAGPPTPATFRTRLAAASAIAYWPMLNATRHNGLREMTSSTTEATDCAATAGQSPASSSSAKAKLVLTVSSSCSPRRGILSGSSSPKRTPAASRIATVRSSIEPAGAAAERDPDQQDAAGESDGSAIPTRRRTCDRRQGQ